MEEKGGEMVLGKGGMGDKCGGENIRFEVNG